MLHIDALRFGIAGAIVSGFFIFGLTLVAYISGIGREFLMTLMNLFPGFEINLVGSLVGAGYGMVTGFFKLYFLAFIYNLLASDRPSN